MFQLLGLNLLSLLAQNRLAEFHTVSNDTCIWHHMVIRLVGTIVH